MKRFVWVVVGGVLSVGCMAGAGGGGGEPGRPIAQFPSRADVESVAASQPTSAPKGADNVADVDHWDMHSPATAQPDYPNETKWDDALLSKAKDPSNKVSLSPALRCAAQEMARFFTVTGGMPDDGLREHLLLRCGNTNVAVAFRSLAIQVPDSVPLARLEEGGRAQVQGLINTSMAAQGGEFGLAAARGGGRYVVIGLSAVPRVKFQPFSPIVSGDSVTLDGELSSPAQYLVVLANQGKFGVKHCVVHPTRRLPVFRVTCPIAAEDAATRIEFTTRSDGSVLLQPAALLEVRRDDQAQLAYQATTYGNSRRVANAEEFRQAMLSDLNAARAAAGLKPFTLEQRQSQTVERLAPTLYRTMQSNDEQQSSMISLGLLAGWDVGGMIRDGGIYCSASSASRDPSRWLSQALANPVGRWVLFEPSMSHIGVGATELSPGGEVAVVTTYAFFDNVDHHSDEQTVLAELNRHRAAHGTAPARLIASTSSLLNALEFVHQNKANSIGALNGVIQQTAGQTNHETSGFVVETTDPKLLKFDSVLLDSATLDVEIGVTHYRAPGAAWGQYAILFVILDHGAQTKLAKHTSNRHTL